MAFLSLAVLLSACRPSYQNYEVGELPEERIAKAVKPIAAGLEAMDPALCVSRVTPGFRVEDFDDGAWTEIESGDGTVVFVRGEGPNRRPLDRDALQQVFAEYLSGWRVVSRALAKIRDVQFDDDQVRARAHFYLDVYGLSADGGVREDGLNLALDLEFQGDVGWITSLRFESPCVGTRSRRAQFRNVSREVNGAWPQEKHPDAKGYLPIPEQTADCGLACGDYDGDGLYDVYLLNGRRNTLLRNRGDGTFEDVTDRAGVGNIEGESRGAILADFDNDGHVDLYVSNIRTPCRLYRNNGDGTFTDVTEGSGLGHVGFSTSCAAADYDRDGKLDLYQCIYGNFYEEFPLPPAESALPDRLYRNLGGMKFQEVSEDAGIVQKGWALACTWGDFDGDMWPEILVANDFGEKRLFRNRQDGTFEDISEEIGLLDRNFGMSAAFGDVDNDGDFDMYFSNMYSNTNWIFQRKELLPMPWFLRPLQKKILGTLDEMTKGNAFFLNNGDGTVTNVTRAWGLEYGQWAWGSEFLDYDADGDLDIYCLNGFISGPDAEDL
ncbi:MAG: VCBS repeat-containing protein [Candidatus Brocadiae bacterium]|nr:VCBS repeat-containing protein [Candidatus Brocadiia bacterium]